MKKILIVEDNVNISQLLREILVSNNYDVECAENGAEGFEKAKKYMPDIILSDVNMPVMNGLEFLSKIKSFSKTSKIPVVMCTEQGMMDDIERAAKLGAKGYVLKPFEVRRVLGKVKELLEPAES